VKLVRSVNPTRPLLLAAITLAVVMFLIYWLYNSWRRSLPLRDRLPWLAALILEPENQTYSLSRAQFYWWLTIIAYAYLFLFFAWGLIQKSWKLPPLAGFAQTFLISLGTLVAVQITSAAKGAKGAGAVHPVPSDLIVHGGVLAPERIQQLVWTILSGVGFLWITIKTYATATVLPTIPNELLVLMGISSAGYVGGKLARDPGPIINQILPGLGSLALRIYGIHLSVEARVWVDDVELPRTSICTLEPDPDHPDKFVKALKVTLPEGAGDTSLEKWLGQEHAVVVENADGQRADWTLLPEPSPSSPPSTSTLLADPAEPPDPAPESAPEPPSTLRPAPPATPDAMPESAS
jgi:hypothetical protein